MIRSLAIVSLLLVPVACADPCVDDGVNQKKNCPGAAENSGTEGSTTTASSESQTASVSSSVSTSNTASAGTMSASGSTMETSASDVTSADASATETDTMATEDATATGGGPGCMNGMLDGDETDVDCGGSCPGCEDGKLCQHNDDCLSLQCNTDMMCGVVDACTNLIDDNPCQACIKDNCCDAVLECYMDEFCHCWVECISHNNDFDPCVDMCNGTMKPGAITSCANSNCNDPGACGN